MPTELYYLLVGGIEYWQGAIVKCGRPRMACSVTEAQSHDQVRGGRSVTGVYGNVTGVQNNAVFSLKICHLVAITIEISKMAKGDKYLEYPDKTLGGMAKLWSAMDQLRIS